MNCMWVSVTDCSRDQLQHLADMIREDETLQIILSHGAPGNRVKKQEEILLRIGMPSHLKGYQYMKTAVEMIRNDMEKLEGITKRLYPDVAKVHKCSAETVEHAIRHAVEVSWKRGDERLQKRIFGYNSMEAKRPTNQEFITRMVEYLERTTVHGFS